jgi:5-methylcytosine-specific restriction endonuclease McrA
VRKGILLLNASFEPLCVVTLRRAMVLVLGEKAVVVASADTELRSVNSAMAMPTVIRLTRYVRVPYRTTVPLSRNALLNRDKGTCQYCGKAGATIDHVLPRSRGGLHEWTNVVIACHKCNNKKDDYLLEELGWKLRIKPVAPHGVGWVVVGIGKVDETWTPYLAMGKELVDA